MELSTRRHTITVITHDNPIGIGSANYLIHADLSARRQGWQEQLWTQRAAPGMYEVACLPFFTRGICYRDVIAIDDRNMVTGVMEKSGHRTLRIALVRQHEQLDELHELLHGKVVEFGHDHEWLQGTYLAIDLPPGTEPTPIVELLEGPAGVGALQWEIDA